MNINGGETNPTAFKKRKQIEQEWKVSLEGIIARNNLVINKNHVSEVVNHNSEVWLKKYANQQ